MVKLYLKSSGREWGLGLRLQPACVVSHAQDSWFILFYSAVGLEGGGSGNVCVFLPSCLSIPIGAQDDPEGPGPALSLPLLRPWPRPFSGGVEKDWLYCRSPPCRACSSTLTRSSSPQRSSFTKTSDCTTHICSPAATDDQHCP